MSLQSTIIKLNPPIKDLVLSVTRDGTEFGGQTVADEKEVIEWVDKTSKANFMAENNVKVCFTHILYESSLFNCRIPGLGHYSHPKNLYCHKLFDRCRRCVVCGALPRCCMYDSHKLKPYILVCSLLYHSPNSSHLSIMLVLQSPVISITSSRTLLSERLQKLWEMRSR